MNSLVFFLSRITNMYSDSDLMNSLIKIDTRKKKKKEKKN